MLVGLLLIPCSAAQAQQAVAVKSKEMSIINQAIAGFKKAYPGPVEMITMAGDLNQPAKLADKVRGLGPKLVLALGVKAATALKAEIKDIPIIVLLVPNAQESGLLGDNVTGVDMEPPVEEQLRQFRRAFPDVGQIGIMYDEKHSGTFIREASRAAAALGIKLVLVKVAQRKDVPDALERVFQESQAVWLIRDPTVLSKELFNRALVMQSEKKRPIFVQTPSFVKAQAVCSFSASYGNQGRRAADVAKKILAGTSVADIPLQAPDGKLTINPNSAAKAGVTVAPAVLNDPGVTKVGQ